MCNAYAQAGLAILGQYNAYREKKAQNKAIRRDQDNTRRNADKGYVHDLNKIDQEKVSADREKILSEIKTKKEREGEIAQKINLGFGDGTKIVQSIGALYDDDWNQINREYDKDVQTFQTQQTEAYANLSKTYNSLTPPTDPSRTGLIIGIASSANQGYQQDQKDKAAKKNG
tara:strand:- start:561 stop:1076 length:516 start_codon:yes stop_codon:yes gene_type:complete